MKKRIILASASPRRIEILNSHGIDAEVMPADVDESLPEGTDPRTACMYNALKKAMHIEKKLIKEGAADGEDSDGALVIAADTIVYDGRILGKPENDEDAFRILSELRGRTHQVMTGVAVADAGKSDIRVFCETTSVSFDDYSDDDIREYIATGEPSDKAGAYAIQGRWSAHVTDTKGDYFNVIGLPWERLKTELISFGADLQ